MDKLFLELSQFTNAKTAREIELEKRLYDYENGSALTKRAEEIYGKTVVNQTHVLQLLQYVRDNNLQHFLSNYGEAGLAMLNDALNDSKRSA